VRVVRNALPHCATLPAEALAEIGAAIRRGRREDAVIASDLREIATRRKLPGIALVFAFRETGLLHIPNPLRVAFEPVDLDERQPGLGPLAESYPGPYASPPRKTPARSWNVYALNRWALPLIGLIIATVSLFLQMSALGDRYLTRSDATLILFTVALTIALSVFVGVSWNQGRWQVIPGGVLVRWKPIVFGGRRTACLTPANSTLIVHQSMVGWEASLIFNYRCLSQKLTDLECWVLLAAWQSTVPRSDLAEWM
jgi:hypothetical protein